MWTPLGPGEVSCTERCPHVSCTNLSIGKTHTIEGSGRKFSERGLIPRVLSYVYKALEGRAKQDEGRGQQDEGRGHQDEGRGEEWEMLVHISYMEIYQDTGYDLLNPGMRPGALMVTLPKVYCRHSLLIDYLCLMYIHVYICT